MQETKLNEGRQTQVFSELTHLQLATTKVHHITNKLICYIEDVLSGKCRGDPQVGRLLTDMISKVPDIPPSQFEHLLNNSMQVCVCVRMHLPVLAFKVFLFGVSGSFDGAVPVQFDKDTTFDGRETVFINVLIIIVLFIMLVI